MDFGIYCPFNNSAKPFQCSRQNYLIPERDEGLEMHQFGSWMTHYFYLNKDCEYTSEPHMLVVLVHLQMVPLQNYKSLCVTYVW